MALNPSRRGWEGQLAAYVSSLGVEAITGKPYKPTTQGKNERFHQTLFRWLDKQPLAATHEELQDQVDRFDLTYNTERPHQGPPGRICPQQSWDATPVAEAPRPKPVPALLAPPISVPVTSELLEVAAACPDTANGTGGLLTDALAVANASEKISGSISYPAITGTRKVRAYAKGVINIGRTLFSVTKPMGGRIIIATWDPESIVLATTEGEIIAEYSWPPTGTAYVGTSKARTHFRK